MLEPGVVAPTISDGTVKLLFVLIVKASPKQILLMAGEGSSVVLKVPMAAEQSQVGWDGSYNKGMKCPDGIYTWKLVFKTLNNDEKLMNVGHVTLIR